MFTRLSRALRLCRIPSVNNFATVSLVTERLKQWNDLCSSKSIDLSNENKSVQIVLNGKDEGNVKLGTCPQQLSCDPKSQLCYINDKVSDIDTPLQSDAKLHFIDVPNGDDAMFSRNIETRDFFNTMWHSSAHLLAYALQQYYGDDVHFLHGPAGDGVPYCFFYEVILDKEAPTDKDIKNIQKIINKLLNQDIVFEHQIISKEEATALFADNPFKLDIIRKCSSPISIYKCGDFIDLCRGPHIHSSKCISVLRLSSANNVESKDGKPHYRFYGNAFISTSAESYYKKMIKEARDRDHRIIGKKLDMIMFDGNSPGNVFFLDRGLFVYNQLVQYLKENYLTDYEEIGSPLMFKSDLWKTSGHYDHYKDNMFRIDTNSQEEVFLKPMNCPSHCIVFNSKVRSYRDLPIRYSEFSAVHRQENSGALGGLTRLNMFHQDDGHIFCRKDQIGEEITGLLNIIKSVYSKLGFSYSFVLSTQPKDSVGQNEEWKDTEAQLRSILEEQKLQYTVEEGDGAFYAPKIDVLIQDSICRYHQCGTIQLDVQLPKKFGLKYRNSSGGFDSPVLIHRAIYGSLERFMGVFIEHCNGRFPLRFSPYQIALLPVSDETHLKFCRDVATELMKGCRRDLRVDVFPTDLSLSKRIRECTMKHYNYMITIGDEEVSNKNLSVRSREDEDIEQFTLESFKSRILSELSL